MIASMLTRTARTGPLFTIMTKIIVWIIAKAPVQTRKKLPKAMPEEACPLRVSVPTGNSIYPCNNLTWGLVEILNDQTEFSVGTIWPVVGRLHIVKLTQSYGEHKC